MAHSIDRRIAATVGPQHGVAHRRQLAAAGVSAYCIRQRIGAGTAREVFPNVFAFGPGAHCLSDAALAMAGVLYLGPDAAASHSGAAKMHGIWDRHDGTIHVVTSQRRRPIAAQSRVVQHRTIHRIGTLRPLIDGIPTTDVTRTIVEVGQELSTFQATHIAYQADFMGLLDQQAIRRALTERHGEPGTRVVAEALRAYAEGSAGTRSRTEDRLVHRLVELGSPRSGSIAAPSRSSAGTSQTSRSPNGGSSSRSTAIVAMPSPGCPSTTRNGARPTRPPDGMSRPSWRAVSGASSTRWHVR